MASDSSATWWYSVYTFLYPREANPRSAAPRMTWLREEPCADQEHEGEREFGDDQQAAQTAAGEADSALALAGAAAGFEGRVEIHMEGADGGRKSEQKAGQNRGGEGEGEDGAIDADELQPWDIAWVDGSH